GTQKFKLDGTTGIITSMEVTAGTITGAMLQTTATASRGIKIDSTNGFVAYNGTVGKVVEITTDGVANFAGNITSGAIITGATYQTTATANQGVKIDSSGIKGYDSTSSTTPQFSLDAAAGKMTALNAEISGKIKAAAIEGTTTL